MYSPTHGKITTEQMIEYIRKFVTKENSEFNEYEITVGTDSQRHKKGTKFVLVVAVHEVGHGGIFFYEPKNYIEKVDLTKKIHTEVQMSIEMAEFLCREIEKWGLPNVKFTHIDVDIGENGVTKKYIKEIIGWVQGVLGGYGIEASIKPNAPTASCIADKLSK